MNQELFRGDVVAFKGPMPVTMRHYPEFTKAVVLGSYSDFYGGMRDDIAQYKIFILEGNQKGPIAWYDEPLLVKTGEMSQREVSALIL